MRLRTPGARRRERRLESWARETLTVRSDPTLGPVVVLEEGRHGAHVLRLDRFVAAFAGAYPDPARMMAAAERLGMTRHVARWVDEGML